MLSAEGIIKLLKLKPLQSEGGYYSQTWRSGDIIEKSALPGRYKARKAFSTAIYYLLTPDTKSKLHRLPTDEIYHFYLGDPVQMLLLHENGKGENVTLGPDIESGQHPQFVVPRGVWQGSFLIEGGRFALMGTTMAPGFDYSDYEFPDQKKISEDYPDFQSLIAKLCA